MHQNLRYFHILSDPKNLSVRTVGCKCAARIEQNPFAAEERINVLRLRNERKKNFFKKRWNSYGDGIHYLMFKGKEIIILEKYGYGRKFEIIYGDRIIRSFQGQRIYCFEFAQEVAFEIIDPLPEGYLH